MSFPEVVLEGPRYVTRVSVELYLGTTLVFAMGMLIWNELRRWICHVLRVVRVASRRTSAFSNRHGCLRLFLDWHRWLRAGGFSSGGGRLAARL